MVKLLLYVIRIGTFYAYQAEFFCYVLALLSSKYAQMQLLQRTDNSRPLENHVNEVYMCMPYAIIRP